MRAWAIALVALLGAGPAWAADQFDLICTAKGGQVHYRIDLNTGDWCAGDCKVVNKVAAATSGMLTLQDRRPAYRGDWEATNTINRSTGEWKDYSFDAATDTLPFQRRGSCEAAPFSGMPKPKF